MNIFLEWLKPGAKIKRWISVIILGFVIVAFSLAQLMSLNIISTKIIITIVVEFILGILIAIFGIINIQKRTLEIYVEIQSMEENLNKNSDLNLKSLITNRKSIYKNGPKVVVIGGGSGINVIISGLKKYTDNITAIVALSAYEKNYSSEKLNLLPYSDIKESISSLAENPDSLRKLLSHNFTYSKLAGLNFGDIYLLAMLEMFGNIPNSIRNSTQMLNIIGEVVPVSADEITVCAELTDGSVVRTKEEIPKKVIEKLETIKRIYIDPTNAKPSPRAIEAINDADLIVIGPGNLYTNIIPNILVKGVAKAIQESKAKKVFVSNIMTDEGQTDGYKLSHHIKAIFDHANCHIFDYVICDIGNIIPEYLRKYHKEGKDIVEIDNEAKDLNVNIIKKDVSKIVDGRIRHDSDAIAYILMRLVLSEIKFDDKADKLQLMVLNKVLKQQAKYEKNKNRKISKLFKKIKNSVFKNSEKPSQFSQKYLSRLETLKNIAKKEKMFIEEMNQNKEEEKEKEQENKKEEKVITQDKSNLKNNVKKDMNTSIDEGIEYMKEVFKNTFMQKQKNKEEKIEEKKEEKKEENKKEKPKEVVEDKKEEKKEEKKVRKTTRRTRTATKSQQAFASMLNEMLKLDKSRENVREEISESKRRKNK